MPTPVYLGAQQPIALQGDGLFGRLASYFGGGGTPAYAGAGQPAPTAAGLLRPSTVAYAAAPIRTPVAQADDAPLDTDLEVSDAAQNACPIDPAALAAGSIAIVIPRDLIARERLIP